MADLLNTVGFVSWGLLGSGDEKVYVLDLGVQAMIDDIDVDVKVEDVSVTTTIEEVQVSVELEQDVDVEIF